MAILKGGRGQKAPWETVMVRCPEPIKGKVQSMIDDWKRSQLDPDYQAQNQTMALDDLKLIVERILRQKKSARVSVMALLSELGYHIEQ